MSARASRSVALVAVLLLAAGCAPIPNPVARPAPPDALHPNVPVPAVQPPQAAPPDPTTMGELDRHQATWDALGLGDYSMTVMYGCVCALAGRPIAVTITDGRLTKAVDAGSEVGLDALIGFPATVDALFDYARRNSNAGKIEFAWNERFGLPTAIGIDPDLAKRDDEVRIAVLEFAPGP